MKVALSLLLVCALFATFALCEDEVRVPVSCKIIRFLCF